MTTISVRAATQPARMLASLLLGAAVLAGCDSALFDDPIRQAVRATLKDPDSARFGAVVQGEGYACIRYNARNGFGGYAGESWAALRMEINGWRVLDGDAPTCDQGSLRQLAARDKAQAEKNKAAAAELAEGQIKAVFVARGLLPAAQGCAVPAPVAARSMPRPRLLGQGDRGLGARGEGRRDSGGGDAPVRPGTARTDDLPLPLKTSVAYSGLANS